MLYESGMWWRLFLRRTAKAQRPGDRSAWLGWSWLPVCCRKEFQFLANVKVSDGNQPAVMLNWSVSESAGSRSLGRLVRPLSVGPCIVQRSRHSRPGEYSRNRRGSLFLGDCDADTASENQSISTVVSRQPETEKALTATCMEKCGTAGTSGAHQGRRTPCRP